MAKELSVNLSMEWQCEQFACANALPAMTFGSALHTVALTNTFDAITTDEAILTLSWASCFKLTASALPDAPFSDDGHAGTTPDVFQQ